MLWVTLAVLVFSVDAKADKEAIEIKQLKKEIQSKYDFDVEAASGDCSISQNSFHIFLKKFFIEAKEGELGKRSIPFGKYKYIKVYPNWRNCKNFSTNIFGKPRIQILKTNVIGVRWDSASSLIRFLKRFPLEGTDEAFRLQLRNMAVKQAIQDIFKDMEQVCGKVFMLKNTIDNADFYSSKDSHSIYYPTQEKLLQGLLNHLPSIKEKCQQKKSSPHIIEITNQLLHPYKAVWTLKFSNGYYYDKWNLQIKFPKEEWVSIDYIDDETNTEKVISQYMEKLKGKLYAQAAIVKGQNTSANEKPNTNHQLQGKTSTKIKTRSSSAIETELYY